MAVDGKLRALVVDDEQIIRMLNVRALRDEGFFCDSAADGHEASALLAMHDYDVLVTDLKMPNRHGHALVCEALELAPRPVIIVLTGVAEPKLARDLLVRGVEEVSFKPTDPFILAAKARAMVLRRQRAEARSISTAASGSSGLIARLAPFAETEEGPVDAAALDSKLTDVAAVLPISSAALDVYEMTRSCDWGVPQIAAAIQRDPSLAAEVLRLANSSFLNVTGKRISDLDQAVMSIGQNRIGEMALAMSARTIATPTAVPWMNLDLAWRRSMAAGVAVEALLHSRGGAEVEPGLMLSAIMYPLGRVVLGTLFPTLYQRMVNQCWRSSRALRELERESIPRCHTAALAQLLTEWRLPAETTAPLKHAGEGFDVLARLADASRARAEALKLAVLIGRLAIARWEEWDTVELPSPSLWDRYCVTDVGRFVAGVRGDAAKLANFCPGKSSAATENDRTSLRTIAYCSPGGATDALACMLPAFGYQARPIGVYELRDLEEPVIVNGLELAASRFAAARGSSEALVVTTAEKEASYSKFARTVALPCSFAKLRAAVLSMGQTAQPVAAMA
ncbi:MAG TPA: HDOD domain-containing protein [Lacipirellulaceae bacterium]|nr:HDOD domain-containing protein [Lacipirellulaceae bacterium]